MDDQETDARLREIFKRNAPSFERAQLSLALRSDQRAAPARPSPGRYLKTVAIALGVLVLAVLAVGVGTSIFEAVTHFGKDAPIIVITDKTTLSPAPVQTRKTLVMATDVLVEDPASKEGTSTVVGDVTQHRGVVEVTEVTATDLRLSGRQVLELKANVHDDGTGAAWGTVEISNAGGSWKGATEGALGGLNQAYGKMVLKGTGQYQGLEAHLQVRTTDAHDPPGVFHVWTGWIQKTEAR